jgi:hypothetical protein
MNLNFDYLHIRIIKNVAQIFVVFQILIMNALKHLLYIKCVVEPPSEKNLNYIKYNYTQTL